MMAGNKAPIRIAVTGDLHYDPSGQLTPPRMIRTLVEAIRAEKPDALIIAGDLAHGLTSFQECLRLFAGLEIPVGIIAGNHDVWADRQGHHSSQGLWADLLPAAARNASAIWLESENMLVGDVAIVGSMVWYDYSAIDPGLNLTADEIASSKKRMNNDAHMIDWPYSDPELAGLLREGLGQRLETASTAASVQKIVLVTHVPIFEQQILRKSYDPDWGLSNAYFGNLTTGNMVLNYTKVQSVISGHTHVVRHGLAERVTGEPVECSVIASDYGKPTYILATV